MITTNGNNIVRHGRQSSRLAYTSTFCPFGRLILGMVFAFSGLGKAIEREKTIRLVKSYEILPEFFATIYGFVLPWLELTLAALLIFGIFTQLAALTLCLLLVSFAVAVSVNLARGKQMDCGCFGSANREKLSWATVARISLLLSFALVVATSESQYLSLDSFLISRIPASLQEPPLLGFLPVLMTASLVYLGPRLAGRVTRLLLDHRQLDVELRKGHL